MRKLLAAITVIFAVVAATGVYQAFRYYPRGSQWWSDVHRWSSILLMLLVLAALFVWLRNRATAQRGAVQVSGLVVATIAVIAAFVTGPTLQWESLARFRVDLDIRGVFDTDGLMSVVADGQVHSAETFRRTVWVHTTILPILLAAAVAVVWFLSSRQARVGHDEAVEVVQ